MAKQNKEPKWQAGKGKFVLKGIVTGLNLDTSYREGTADKGANMGKDYRSLTLGIQTSPTNTIYPSLFGSEGVDVYAYNSNKEPKLISVDWSQRSSLPDGYGLLGINLFIEKDTKGKNIRQNLVPFEAIEYLREHLEDGMSVEVKGNFRFSTYENKNGDVVNQTNYNVNSVSVIAPIDFESEKFEEVSSFEQDVVIRDVVIDREATKAYVNAYILQKKDEFTEAQFAIDGEANEKMFKNFPKLVKFGHSLHISGKCINSVTVSETAQVDEDDPFGSEKPAGLGVTRSYVNELRITAVDTANWDKTFRYKESDFITEADEDFGDEGKGDDPFNEDGEDPFED